MNSKMAVALSCAKPEDGATLPTYWALGSAEVMYALPLRFLWVFIPRQTSMKVLGFDGIIISKAAL